VSLLLENIDGKIRLRCEDIGSNKQHCYLFRLAASNFKAKIQEGMVKDAKYKHDLYAENV
jgi:hypothetical protein